MPFGCCRSLSYPLQQPSFGQKHPIGAARIGFPLQLNFLHLDSSHRLHHHFNRAAVFRSMRLLTAQARIRTAFIPSPKQHTIKALTPLPPSFAAQSFRFIRCTHFSPGVVYPLLMFTIQNA